MKLNDNDYAMLAMFALMFAWFIFSSHFEFSMEWIRGGLGIILNVMTGMSILYHIRTAGERIERGKR